jgi:glycosyltransferase involved in cell wall biosynthesis
MTPPKPRALFLAPEAPYPLVGGGALRAASLLEYLAQHYTVDAVIFHTPGAPVEFPPGRIDRLLTIEVPYHSKHPAVRSIRNGIRLLRRTPPLVDRFSGFGPPIAAFVADHLPYDLAAVEHFWCAPYLEQIAPHCRHTVLDLHNVESAWHLASGKASDWPQSLAHDVFRRAALDLERYWLPRYSLLLATSMDDAERVRRIIPQARVAIYPNTIPLVDCPPRDEQDAIAFSGTLEYEPNRAAVRYFAAKIWPALREKWPDLKWRLIGQHPEGVEKYVRGDPRIDLTGPVEDAILHLAAAKVAVVPLLAGSGTRLKIVEAWAAGTPVVSTSVGAEGLPAVDGENILLADDAVSFAAAISKLLSSPSERERLARAGRNRYERELTWNSAWSALGPELRNLR